MQSGILKSRTEKKKKKIRDFPGDQCLRLRTSSARVMGSIPSQGTKIPHASRCSQKCFFFFKKEKKDISGESGKNLNRAWSLINNNNVPVLTL